MTQAATAAVRKQIVAAAPQQGAFEVFTAGFGDSKPREHNLMAAPIARTVFEPRVGGHTVDIPDDGSECRWARILAFEPHDRVAFSWDIGPDWQLVADPDNASEVEVRFIAESPERTRVELEHRHLDRHGPGWEAVRDGIADGARWPLYVDRYADLFAKAADLPPIVATAEVDRPAGDVFPYTTDPTRFPEWQAGVVSGRMDDGGARVGVRCVTVRRIGGAQRPSTSQLLWLEPPRAWAVRGLQGPIRAAVDVTVEPLGADRSRVAIAVDFTGWTGTESRRGPEDERDRACGHPASASLPALPDLQLPSGGSAGSGVGGHTGPGGTGGRLPAPAGRSSLTAGPQSDAP